MHDETVKTAIDANDYSLLSADAQSKISQDLFALKVAHKAKKDAYKAQLETIVQSNDFEAFKTQVEAMKAEKETMKEAMLAEKLATATPEEKADIEARIVKKAEKKAEREAARAESGVSEDERLLEKFTKITEYYTENGTLPEKGMKRGKR